MATIPRKPQQVLAEDSGPRLVVDGSSQEHPPKAGSLDALEGLLAFSSLREQIRARRAHGKNDYLTNGSSDQFFLYEVLQPVAERALALTGADGVAIALLQEGEIICRARTGIIAPELGARLDPQSGLSGICIRMGETVSCDDAENDARVDVTASRDLRARAIIAVPLKARRSVIGLLEAFSGDPFAFSASDVRSLNLLAELILGAMRPEEDDKPEDLSIKAVGGAPLPEKQAGAGCAFSANTAEDNLLDLEITEDSAPTPAEIPPALLRDYEKSSASRLSLIIISALAFAVLMGVGVLLSEFRTPLAPAAAAFGSATAPRRLGSRGRGAATAVPVAADLPQPTPIAPEDANRNVLPLLTGVRHWEAGDSTTVVIDLEDQVQYEVHRLSSPERIYFDLHDTVLAPGLNGTSIEIGNNLLLRIRIAEPIAGVARVVLDTKDVSNFSVGLEPNPSRLVVEIRHNAGDMAPEANIDLLRPSRQAFRRPLTLPAAPVSKEDLELRSRVPHLRIVIDAGHGGWDLGTVGRKGVVEKDLVLDISQRLGKMLKTRLGSEILYTRSDDAYVPLEERAEIANDARADLFVSLHANNSDHPAARGIETYYTNVSAPANSLEIEKRENATAMTTISTTVLSDVALRERTQESRKLAASVERALYGILAPNNPGMRDRGVKQAGFVVLAGTTMPAVLAEVSFLSSPADERKLLSPTYRQQVAEALYRGIARYAASSSHMKLASAR